MILPASYSNGFAPRDGQPLYPELWRGCVGAWNPGLGPTGLRLYDWSPYRNHGTLTNMDGNDWVASQGRYALDFDGSNDVVAASIPLVPNNLCTQSYWFRRTATSTLTGFVGFGVNSSSNSRFVLQPWSDGVVYITVADTTTEFNWGQFNSNDTLWHHLAAVFDGTKTTNASRLVVFFDGKPISLTYSGTIPATFGSPTLLRMGQTFAAANNFGSGMIDGYLIHNRALSPNEIRLLATRPGIAYEMAPRRWSAAMIEAYRRRTQYAQLVGGGII